MEVRQTFAPGQSVTVLTDDGFLFVGKIISCDCKFECEVCDDDRLKHHSSCEDDHEDDHKKKKKEHECDRFLVLQLEEDVEVGGPPGPSVTAFEEGDTVFINFCQIIAIGQGFPPEKKESC
jgi:hypothetical protein